MPTTYLSSCAVRTLFVPCLLIAQLAISYLGNAWFVFLSGPILHAQVCNQDGINSRCRQTAGDEAGVRE